MAVRGPCCDLRRDGVLGTQTLFPSCLFQGMLMEGPPGPEGPAVSVVLISWACGRCLVTALKGPGWKRGGTHCPLQTPPGPSAALAHPHPPLKRGGVEVLPCGRPFEFCPDFIFNSRVSQDLRERWGPLAKWVTREKG